MKIYMNSNTYELINTSVDIRNAILNDDGSKISKIFGLEIIVDNTLGLKGKEVRVI